MGSFSQVKQFPLAVGITSQDKSLCVGGGLKTALHARKFVGSSWAISGFSDIFSLYWLSTTLKYATLLDTPILSFEVFKKIKFMHKRKGNFQKLREDTEEVSRYNEESELIPEDVELGMDRFK